MAAIELSIRPGLGQDHVPGGFIAFGLGSDIDEAFDYAATGDRLAVGDSGLIPSAAGIDPAGRRDLRPDPVHPLSAMQAALDTLAGLEPGQVIAQAVQPLADFRHRRVRIAIDDPALVLPDRAGIVDHPTATLLSAVDGLLSDGEAPIQPDERVVQIELLREPRRRFKVAAENFRGATRRMFAVYTGANPAPLATFPSQAEAKRWAMAAARQRDAAAMVLEIRPTLVRNDGDPFVRIERRCITQKAALRVTLAGPKRPDRVRVNGWLFFGRVG